ncbi:hypothetical protein [Candidatus Parabeggiatoa sp. HSG14]|uniref:hypothetical protein n=1 Tax=Candidatus Parabeggiatoa sp. HSG14 TaxID=3055593 RepID=UPI0025A8BB94|nr:hypothetical protein [Thiotrichales bacterium HSG14]
MLAQSEYHFNEAECDFLKQVTGGHPYLLQIAIPLLIEARNKKNPLKVPKRFSSIKPKTYSTMSCNYGRQISSKPLFLLYKEMISLT